MKNINTDSLAILGISLGAVISAINTTGTFTIWNAVSGLLIFLLFINFSSAFMHNKLLGSIIIGFSLLSIIGFGGDYILSSTYWDKTFILGITGRDSMFIGAWIIFSILSYFILKWRFKT